MEKSPTLTRLAVQQSPSLFLVSDLSGENSQVRLEVSATASFSRPPLRIKWMDTDSSKGQNSTIVACSFPQGGIKTLGGREQKLLQLKKITALQIKRAPSLPYPFL